MLRRALFAAGVRFRLQRHLAKGCTPDIVLPGRRVAVFVDGCFWHGCPEHGRKTPWSGPNAALWEEKMQRNAERDQRSTTLATELGWDVVRLWECEIRQDPAAAATQVLSGSAFADAEAPSEAVPRNQEQPVKERLGSGSHQR